MPLQLLRLDVQQSPGQLDRLSESLLDSLKRPAARPVYRGLIWTTIWSGLTLGMFPLLRAGRWLRDYASLRQQRFWHVAQWLRFNTADPDASKLEALAGKIKPDPGGRMIVRLLVFFAFCALGNALHLHPIDRVYSDAFHWPQTTVLWVFANCITLAALVSFLRLIDHRGQIRDFIDAFNAVLARQSLPPLTVPMGRPPLIWIIVGLLLSMFGGYWALAVLLMLGTQRSYIRRNAVLHADLARRIEAMLKRQGPPLNVPPPSDLTPRCANEKCGAPLAVDATFCPRCGRKSAA